MARHTTKARKLVAWDPWEWKGVFQRTASSIVEDPFE